MRTAPIQTLKDESVSTTSVNSNGIYMAQIFCYSMIAIFVGAPVGSVKIQVSNDNVPVAQGVNPSLNVVNWVDLPSSTQAVAAAGQFFLKDQDIGYLWARLVYTRTSGTGTLTVNATIKGA